MWGEAPGARRDTDSERALSFLLGSEPAPAAFVVEVVEAEGAVLTREEESPDVLALDGSGFRMLFLALSSDPPASLCPAIRAVRKGGEEKGSERGREKEGWGVLPALPRPSLCARKVLGQRVARAGPLFPSEAGATGCLIDEAGAETAQCRRGTIGKATEKRELGAGGARIDK